MSPQDSPAQPASWYKSHMRRWMRDRMKRRNQNRKAQPPAEPSQGPAPLQPTFLDRDDFSSGSEGRAELATPEPVYEAQPEHDPFEGEAAAGAQPGGRRSRRRGRGGRGRNRSQQPPKALPDGAISGLPITPGQATGEAAEIDSTEAADDRALDAAENEGMMAAPSTASESEPRKTAKAKKGAVVLAIGLPGSGKSSWFKRHNIIPLSSDLVRGLLFDDATEQRFQDLVFSSLRSLLRARLIADRPMNFIDATNLSPKERHSWIRMAQDFGYEAHAVFFDVPTEVCMERNRKRSRNVPDEVMLRMAQKLRPPKFDEGFAKIIVVRLKNRPAASEAPAEQTDEDTED